MFAPFAVDLADSSLFVVFAHVSELVIHVSERVLLLFLGLLHVELELEIHEAGQIGGFVFGRGEKFFFESAFEVSWVLKQQQPSA